jgi:hypothetical protein
MYKDICVIATFRTNGDIRPLYLEIEENNEKITYMIDEYSVTKRCFAAIDSMEFTCILENKKEVILLYFVRKHQWKMVISP